MSRPRCAKLCSIDQTGVLTRFQTLNCSNRFEETFLFNWEKFGLSLAEEKCYFDTVMKKILVKK